MPYPDQTCVKTHGLTRPAPYTEGVTTPVSELLREYQGYVLAYRLRRAVGGRVAPPREQLTLAQYAARRLETSGPVVPPPTSPASQLPAAAPSWAGTALPS